MLRRLAACLALALAVACPVQAQTSCPVANAVTRDCTSTACKAEACWATADASLSGCNLYITTPNGALPAISGSMTTPGRVCTVQMPKLITGVHQLNARGLNAFGEGAPMATPFALTTGTVPAAPSAVAMP